MKKVSAIFFGAFLFFCNLFLAQETDATPASWYLLLKNNPPTDISLASSSVLEDQPVGTLVGTFSSSDADCNDSHSYSLVSGTGDSDNASFSIAGNALRTAVVFDYDSKNSFSVRVRVTDLHGGTFDKVFLISVDEVPPPDLDIIVFSMSPVLPDTDDAITFTAIVKNISSGPSAPFHLSLKVGSETPPKYSIPALSGGETFTVQRTLTLHTAKWYWSEVIADCDGEINESDETNNSESFLFPVTETFKPDLDVIFFSLWPESPTTNDEITFTAIVKNISLEPCGPFHLSFQIGAGTIPKYLIPALAGGETFTVQRTITLHNAYWYYAEAIADCDGEIDEIDETNNNEIYIFEVTAP